MGSCVADPDADVKPPGFPAGTQSAETLLTGWRNNSKGILMLKFIGGTIGVIFIIGLLVVIGLLALIF